MSNSSVMKGLYNDAVFLKENDRLRGCICLLLCIIDGCAKQKYPTTKSNRERYIEYLKVKLKKLGIDQVKRIEEKNKCLHLSEIIYEYFRCNMIHEGDSRDNYRYEVQIEYEDSGRFRYNSPFLMDRVNMKLIYKADWLIEILLKIINDELNA